MHKKGPISIPVVVLKEGSKRTRRENTLKTNIMVASILGEAMKSSLGPNGLDKMLVDTIGNSTITNDGATILKNMEVQHPIGKILVEIAKTQDEIAGDGTTTVVVLAGELLKEARALLEKRIHPTIIVEGYGMASKKAQEITKDIALKVDPKDKEILKKIARIAISTKMVAEYKNALADQAVDAVLQVIKKTSNGYEIELDDIDIQKKPGGSLSDTELLQGLVVDKEIAHIGMPRRVNEAKIALIVLPFEVKKTTIDSKLSIEGPEQIEAFTKEERNLVIKMVDKLIEFGVNVLMCQREIDDKAQHYLAERKILAIRRVKVADMERLAKATGGRIITNIDELGSRDIGFAKLVEERKFGKDKPIFIEGCRNPKALTIFVRGGTEQVIDEASRTIHDALCVIRDVVSEPYVLGGGGASEFEISKRLKEFAEKTKGKEQLAILSFAKALESIPAILAENAGLNSIDILTKLRSYHNKGKKWYCISPSEGGVINSFRNGILEPLTVKTQSIISASEAAQIILRVDDVMASVKSQINEKQLKDQEENINEGEKKI